LSHKHRTFTIGCFLTPHSSSTLLLLKTTDMSEALGTSPTSQLQRTEPRTDAPKMAPFSREKLYNPTTTRKPVICQFEENALFVSYVRKKLYKNHKNCERFQCTFLIPQKEELTTSVVTRNQKECCFHLNRSRFRPVFASSFLSAFSPSISIIVTSRIKNVFVPSRGQPTITSSALPIAVWICSFGSSLSQ